jgi:hypothetical protein
LRRNWLLLITGNPQADVFAARNPGLPRQSMQSDLNLAIAGRQPSKFCTRKPGTVSRPDAIVSFNFVNKLSWAWWSR